MTLGEYRGGGVGAVEEETFIGGGRLEAALYPIFRSKALRLLIDAERLAEDTEKLARLADRLGDYAAAETLATLALQMKTLVRELEGLLGIG